MSKSIYIKYEDFKNLEEFKNVVRNTIKKLSKKDLESFTLDVMNECFKFGWWTHRKKFYGKNKNVR